MNNFLNDLLKIAITRFFFFLGREEASHLLSEARLFASSLLLPLLLELYMLIVIQIQVISFFNFQNSLFVFLVFFFNV